jgi:hypothetical protein
MLCPSVPPKAGGRRPESPRTGSRSVPSPDRISPSLPGDARDQRHGSDPYVEQDDQDHPGHHPTEHYGERHPRTLDGAEHQGDREAEDQENGGQAEEDERLALVPPEEERADHRQANGHRDSEPAKLRPAALHGAKLIRDDTPPRLFPRHPPILRLGRGLRPRRQSSSNSCRQSMS